MIDTQWFDFVKTKTFSMMSRPARQADIHTYSGMLYKAAMDGDHFKREVLRIFYSLDIHAGKKGVKWTPSKRTQFFGHDFPDTRIVRTSLLATAEILRQGDVDAINTLLDLSGKSRCHICLQVEKWGYLLGDVISDLFALAGNPVETTSRNPETTKYGFFMIHSPQTDQRTAISL